MIGIPNRLPKYLKVAFRTETGYENGVIIDANDPEVPEELKQRYSAEYDLQANKQNPKELPVVIKSDAGTCVLSKIVDISTYTKPAPQPEPELDVASELHKIYTSLGDDVATKDGESVSEALRSLLFRLSNKN